MEVAKLEKTKLNNTEKSSWTSSSQINVKPLVTNLKGKTTVSKQTCSRNLNGKWYEREYKPLILLLRNKKIWVYYYKKRKKKK